MNVSETITSIADYNRVITASNESHDKEERKRLRTLAKGWMQAQEKAGYRHVIWTGKGFNR